MKCARLAQGIIWQSVSSALVCALVVDRWISLDEGDAPAAELMGQHVTKDQADREDVTLHTRLSGCIAVMAIGTVPDMQKFCSTNGYHVDFSPY